MIGDFNQIFCAWSFPNQHRFRIIGFGDFSQLCDLIVHRFGSHLIFRSDQQQLIIVTDQCVFQFFRYEFFGNQRSFDRVESEHEFHTVFLFHFIRHFHDLLFFNTCIHQKHMRGVHVEFFLQLFICLNGSKVSWK